MTLDDTSARRLVDFCEQLPSLPSDAARAQADVVWALEQFGHHEAQLQQRLSSSAMDHERLALRCEIDAFQAAASVLEQLFQRRFGRALAGP